MIAINVEPHAKYFFFSMCFEKCIYNEYFSISDYFEVIICSPSDTSEKDITASKITIVKNGAQIYH